MELNENISKIFANLFNRIDPISSSCSTTFNGLNFLFQDHPFKYCKSLLIGVGKGHSKMEDANFYII